MDETVESPAQTAGSTKQIRDMLLIGTPLFAEISDMKQLQDGSYVVSIIIDGVEYADEVVLDGDVVPAHGEAVSFTITVEGEKPHMSKTIGEAAKVEVTPEA